MTEKTNLCRFCSTEGKEVCEILTNEYDLVQKVEVLTSLKIVSHDNLPKKTCFKCIENINLAYKIRKDIIHSHYSLLERNEKNLHAENDSSELQSEAVSSDIGNEFTEGTELPNVAPFETVFLPGDNSNVEETSDNRKRKAINIENKILQKTNTKSSQNNVNNNEQQKLMLKKVQQYKLQQHHHRIIYQQKLQMAKIQLQQQRLQKLPLIQQKKFLENQKLIQMQRQKLALQQKQKQISFALKDKVDETKKQNENEVKHSLSKNHFRRAFRPDKRSFNCEICSMNLASKFSYRLHMKKHETRTCEICHVTIRSDNFKKHYENVHDDAPAVCEICGKVAKNKESLRGHMYYIHSKRTSEYRCEHCDKIFKSKHGYLHHVKKTHLGIRNHQCDICGKKFYSNYDVKKHIKMTHEGARPHVCPYCKKGFSSTNARKVHMRQHTRETPYICEECGLGFRQKVSLKTHLKSKHNLDIKDIEANQQPLNATKSDIQGVQ